MFLFYFQDIVVKVILMLQFMKWKSVLDILMNLQIIMFRVYMNCKYI